MKSEGVWGVLVSLKSPLSQVSNATSRVGWKTLTGGEVSPGLSESELGGTCGRAKSSFDM